MEDSEIGGMGWSEITTLIVGTRDQTYIADAIAGVIFELNADGTPSRTIGRPGEGPGEFQQLTTIGFRADTLWAWDASNQRLTLFNEAGEFLSTRLVPSVVEPPITRAFGSLLANGSTVDVPIQTQAQASSRIPVWQSDPQRRRQGTFGEISNPASRMLQFATAGGGAVHLANPVVVTGRWATSSDGALVAVSDPALVDGQWQMQVSSFTSDGKPRYAAKLPIAPDVVRMISSRDTIATLLAMSLHQSEARRLAASSAAADETGFVHRLLVSRDGTTWIGLHGENVTTWYALDATGNVAGSIAVPLPWHVKAIEDDMVWMASRDEWNVPTLRKGIIERS